MKRMLVVAGGVGLGLIILVMSGIVQIGPEQPARDHPKLTSLPPPSALPDRHTATPAPHTPFVRPTAPLTLHVTSPFVFPTHPPAGTLDPAQDCTAVFPLDTIENIEFGRTTMSQLEASFGRATYHGGRPTRFRFEEENCLLLVTPGPQEVLEVELVGYSTLGLLLERYGPPAAVGISQGNLTLLLIGDAVLLYPEAGIIAVFDLKPAELVRSTPIRQLYFRPPYVVEKQIARLNLQPVTWQTPLR